MNAAVISAVVVSTLNLAYSELTCNGRQEFSVTTSSWDGSITSMYSLRTPAGVCWGSIVPDTDLGFGAVIITGEKLVCKDGSMYLQEFGDADCNGDPKEETLVQDGFLVLLNVTYRCDLDDCDYIKIRAYDDTDDCDSTTPTITDTSTFVDGLYINDDCNIASIATKATCNGDGTATEKVWSDGAICYDNTTKEEDIYVITTTESSTGYGCGDVSTYWSQNDLTSTGYSYYYVECGTAASDGSSSSDGGGSGSSNGNGNSGMSTTTAGTGNGNGNGVSSTMDKASPKSNSHRFIVSLFVKYMSYLVVCVIFA